MRRLHLAIAGGLAAVAAVGGTLSWWLTRPAPLGLERSRVVLAAGDVTVDGARAVPKQLLTVGSTVHTGRGSSACFSVHGSRVCVGANAEVVLAELGEASATIQATRGAVIVASVRDDVHVILPTGSVVARAATVAIEDAGGPGATVRALEGSVPVKSTGQADVLLAAPEAVLVKDGKKRPRAQALEAEEHSVVVFAGSWQGTAGAVIAIDGVHGRVEVDGADLGLAPAAILVAEGTHTVIVRDGGHETMHETMTLKAGERVVRGG
jgi:hypothetical protein